MIDHHGHARPAVIVLGAVEPDRIGVVDSDRKDISAFAGSGLESGENGEGTGWNTRSTESGLRYGMVRREEVEVDFVTDGSSDNTWAER